MEKKQQILLLEMLNYIKDIKMLDKNVNESKFL